MDNLCEFLKRGVELEDLLDLTGQGMEAVDNLVPSLREGDAVLRKLEGDHHESDVLRGVGLT